MTLKRLHHQRKIKLILKDIKMHIKIIDDNNIELIDEEIGRPKLVKFAIKKNNLKWSIKNLNDGEWYYLKINPESETESLYNFLSSVSAYDANDDLYNVGFKKTQSSVSLKRLAQNVASGVVNLVWIPKNRLSVIKSTWNLTPQEDFGTASTSGDTMIKNPTSAQTYENTETNTIDYDLLAEKVVERLDEKSKKADVVEDINKHVKMVVKKYIKNPKLVDKEVNEAIGILVNAVIKNLNESVEEYTDKEVLEEKYKGKGDVKDALKDIMLLQKNDDMDLDEAVEAVIEAYKIKNKPAEVTKVYKEYFNDKYKQIKKFPDGNII
jgi:hypothetical protein